MIPLNQNKIIGPVFENLLNWRIYAPFLLRNKSKLEWGIISKKWIVLLKEVYLFDDKYALYPRG